MDVQVHIPGNAGHLAGAGILPDVVLIVEVGHGHIVGQPHGISREFGHIQVEIVVGGVLVEHPGPAGLPHGLQEAQGGLGELGVGDALGPGSHAVGIGLPVEDQGVGDVVVGQGVHGVDGLLRPLLIVEGLGEEVDPHLDVVVQTALEVLVEGGVHHQLAGAVAPVAQAEDGKVHPGVLHRGPVDVPLVLGHVDTDAAGVVCVVIDQEAVLVVGEGRGVVGVLLDIVPDRNGLPIPLEVAVGSLGLRGLLGRDGLDHRRVLRDLTAGILRGLVSRGLLGRGLLAGRLLHGFLLRRRLLGGLLRRLGFFPFQHPPDHGADLRPADGGLGLEHQAVPLLDPQEDAVVIEGQHREVHGVGKGRAAVVGPLAAQGLGGDLGDLQAADALIQSQGGGGAQQAPLAGQVEVAAGPVGGGGGLLLVAGGQKDELQGLAQGNGPPGVEGGLAGAGHHAGLVKVLDTGIGPVGGRQVGKGNALRRPGRDHQGQGQGQQQEQGDPSLFHK